MATIAASLTDPNLVWQKVNQALSMQGSSISGAADPTSLNAFRALKLQLSTQKRNVPLYFLPFGEADVDAATGYTGAPSGAFNLYGMWAKKSGTGTTVAFLQLRNLLAITGTGATGALVEAYFKNVGDEVSLIYPKGLAFSASTGFSVVSVTAANGQTPTTGDSDSQHGFLILGA